MGNVVLHLGNIARGWKTAVFSFRENPLHNYWTMAWKRNVAGRSWWMRSPGLLFWGILISLALTAYFVFTAWWMLTTDLGASARFQLITKFTVATSLLVIGGLLFGMVWLLARLFAVAQLALGFLEVQPRQTMRQTLDDMLVVTRLSEQEVLVGIGLHCVKLMAPPLLMLGGAIALAAIVDLALNNPAAGEGTAASISTIGHAVLAFPRFVLHGLLATLVLTFMLVSLGLCQRSGILPSIGASMQVMMQVLLSGGMVFATLSGFALDIDRDTFTPAWGFGVCVLLAIALLYYIARRLSFVRNALAYAMPLVIAGLGLGFLVNSTFEGLFGVTEAVFGNAIWALQSITLFSTTHLAMLASNLAFQSGGNPLFSEWWRYWLLLVFQLALVVIFAEFARDAIRRRKWGAGET